ncbi:MAG TPA: hypothetical protein VLD16_11325 [Gaiellaceae bacterium]|nr:hypothetical protein [Gaiellaceae bacterium]
MALENDLRRIAEAAGRFAADGEDVAGIVPAEPASGIRVYVCAYGSGEDSSWLVLDATAVPVRDRQLVRDAVSIAALCELAEEAAGTEPSGARVATPALLDELGAAGGPEVAAAVGAASEAIAELVADVERGYKLELS